MSEPSRPSLGEITVVISHLADRVADDPGPGLDPILGTSLRRAVVELERFVPGLETPPDPEAARFFRRACEAALADGLHRDALARALRGLSFAPHEPNLHYLAASACFELGAVQEAVLLLAHALWIHPGHAEARRDFLNLTASSEEREGSAPDWAASGSGPAPLEGWEPAGFDESALRFELVEPDDLPSPELFDPERRTQKPPKPRKRTRRKRRSDDDPKRRAA